MSKTAYIVMHSRDYHEDPEPYEVCLDEQTSKARCETLRKKFMYKRADEYKCFYVLTATFYDEGEK